MYSRDISNLFLAGRLISATHVAFGSTRVMATTGHSAQAVGMAAFQCLEKGLEPRDLFFQPLEMKELQQRLLSMGHYIPEVTAEDPQNLALSAAASASSCFQCLELSAGDETVALNGKRAMMIPCRAGKIPVVTFFLNVENDCELTAELRVAKRLGNYTPDVTLETKSCALNAGQAVPLELAFEAELEADQYIFICLMPVDGVDVLLSDERVTGVLSVSQVGNEKVSKGAVQEPPEGIGVERVEFWLPERRPGGKNFAMKLSEPIDLFQPLEVLSGPQRPTVKPNAWVAAKDDLDPCLTLEWKQPVTLNKAVLCFDTDFDHPMETVQMGHSEREIPFCVKDFDLLDDQDNVIYEGRDNHSTRHSSEFSAVETTRLTVRVLSTHGTPAAIFNVQCFGEKK